MTKYRNNVTGAVRIASSYPGPGWTVIREPKPEPRQPEPQPTAIEETEPQRRPSRRRTAASKEATG